MAPARRRRRRILPGALLVLAIAGATYWYTQRESADAATAFSARIACSCRYLDNRELGACEDDLLPGMGLVMLSEDEEDKAVTAWLPLFGSDTARYKEGPGCVLDPPGG